MTVWTKRCCIAIAALALSVSAAEDVLATEPGSSTDSTNRLLVVVTDDDFVETLQPIWCEASLQKSVNTCRELRRVTYLNMEMIRAGSPSLLRGGRLLADGPRRVICFICDSERRVLSCCVGVPNTRQLLGLSEDADELSVSMTLANAAETEIESDVNSEKPTPLSETVRERAMKRVTRHYRPFLTKIDPPIRRRSEITYPVRVLRSG